MKSPHKNKKTQGGSSTKFQPQQGGAPNGPGDYYENLMAQTTVPNFPKPAPPHMPNVGPNLMKYFTPSNNANVPENHAPRPPPPVNCNPPPFPPPPQINPPSFDRKSTDVPKKHPSKGKHETKRHSDKNRKKSSRNNKESLQEEEIDYANRPPEESPQLNVPSEGLVEFFLTHHMLDKKALHKEFSSVLDYTRLVYDFMSNPTKNRFNNVLCYNEGAVKLRPTRNDDGEYIHATRFVTKEGGYIMTQAPLPNTIEDFWRMIWQEEVSVVVSFVDFTNIDECTEYFNLKKGKKKCIGRFNIKTTDIEITSDYAGYFLKVTNKEDEVPREVTVVQWLNWNIELLVDIKDLINFMQIVWNLEKRGKEMKISTKTMTLVHGISGTRRTGTFVVLNLLCKQLYFKKTCNMISTALLVRKYRHNVLRDKNMFAILLLGMIRFSTNIRLLRKDKSYIDKVERYIKNALLTVPPVGKKCKEKQQK
uniref:Tyrosine phosphatase n=1 Tax=Strongyloides papillosus TaxID=174720 RepID=A0A0N5BEA9_STREA